MTLVFFSILFFSFQKKRDISFSMVLMIIEFREVPSLLVRVFGWKMFCRKRAHCFAAISCRLILFPKLSLHFESIFFRKLVYFKYSCRLTNNLQTFHFFEDALEGFNSYSLTSFLRNNFEPVSLAHFELNAICRQKNYLLLILYSTVTQLYCALFDKPFNLTVAFFLGSKTSP